MYSTQIYWNKDMWTAIINKLVSVLQEKKNSSRANNKMKQFV